MHLYYNIIIAHSQLVILPPSSMKSERQQKQPLRLEISSQKYSQYTLKKLGNHFMYAKMVANEKWNDPRLKVISPQYFTGKTVLDIGCNEGILAIPIAIKFLPKMIHAVDIDQKMIKKTKSNIQIFVNKNQNYQYPNKIIEQVQSLPLYFKEELSKRYGQKLVELKKDYQIRPKGINQNHLFPKNILAFAENILNPIQFDKYECILCMNLTKWIHLAYGDQAIRILFDNFKQFSQQGTILILESQPWSSYRRKKNLFAQYTKNYRMILHKPERFKDYLKKLNFDLIQTIKPTAENSLKHEILIFRKQ